MKEKYKIILVEDEAPIRRNLCSKIQACNLPFDIIGVFKNGKQALEKISVDAPHIVLTDIQMPVMNGLELAKNINNKYPDIFVAIISGYNDFEYARDAIKYQVTDYLTKPVDIDELKELLGELEKRLDETNPELNIDAENLLKSRHSMGFVDSICLYLAENYNENISILDIAEKFSCSQEYITRIFKKNKNVTLQHYIISLKICEAKKILRTYNELDIQSVGELVGYPDPYYFSRIFKKYTNMSPTQYRKAYKKVAL